MTKINYKMTDGFTEITGNRLKAHWSQRVSSKRDQDQSRMFKPCMHTEQLYTIHMGFLGTFTRNIDIFRCHQ